MINIKELAILLEKKIKESSRVFIVGHNSPDFDSIGSCIGLHTLVESYQKRAFIVVNDQEDKIEPGTKKIIDENKDEFDIINRASFLEKVNPKALLIVTDVNKKDMISLGEDLDKVSDVIVIDHHTEGENTIETDYKFITTEVSSASEVVTRVLLYNKIKFSKNVANYLLAGINLDTKRFKQNTNSKTHDAAKKLIVRGADIDYVNQLFLEPFESFCRINNLIINGTLIQKYSESLSPVQISFTLDRTKPKSIYQKEDFAKAADRMMKFNGIDASFALGYVDDETIHISARGTKKVNVGRIMKAVGGGGNDQSAGARILSDDILSIEELIMSKISVGLSDEEEEVIPEPQLVKTSKKRNGN